MSKSDKGKRWRWLCGTERRALGYRERCRRHFGSSWMGPLWALWCCSDHISKMRHPATPVRSFIPGLRKRSPCFKKCKNLAQNIEICQLTLSFNLFANFTEFDVLCFKCTVFQYCHSNHWGSWGRPRIPSLRGRLDSRRLASRLCELLLSPRSMRSWLLGGQLLQWAYQAWKRWWRLVNDSLFCWQHKVVLVVSQMPSELLVVLKTPGTWV